MSWFTGLFSKPPKWKYLELLSPNGLVYWVRECEGVEREIRNPQTGEWKAESSTRFSYLPQFEMYHKEDYTKAILKEQQ